MIYISMKSNLLIKLVAKFHLSYHAYIMCSLYIAVLIVSQVEAK